MNDVIATHRECISAVYIQQYYVDHFLQVVEMYPDAELLTNPYEICSFWNEFWESLPDTPEIRRPPFFMICDLAEGSYLEDD